jgi:N-acetylmuramic acid 6-phosphate etherase
VRAHDVVCGITASGRTPFTLGALHQARGLGARTILLSCNPARRADGMPWDVEIDLATGPELLTGSTRLKAGTATKCALNILSTAAMVRLGKVRGNLMAGVLVTNAKLRDRAIRLVSALWGIPRVEAEKLLEANGWDVRRCLPTA